MILELMNLKQRSITTVYFRMIITKCKMKVKRLLG